MSLITERSKISPFMVFYIIMSMQIGVGVLGFQRIIAQTAGHDAWISVLVAGAGGHLILALMYWILQKANGDFIHLHHQLFGRWLGNVLLLALTIYFASMSFVVLRTYIEVIQVWMFPDLRTWEFALAFLLLCLYITRNGFRVVVGVCFFCLIIPFYLLFTFGSVLEYTNFRQLLPVLDHPLPSILKAAKEMTLTMLGYETILLFYPFLKNGQQSSKWGHAALLSTTLFYTLLTVLTLAYFSEKQLQRQVWATLTMWKMVEMPFIERFEYIGIANWLLVILPNVCLGLWCSSRLCTHIFPIQQKYALLVITCICFAAIIAVQDRTGVNTINEVISKVGFYFLYAWIPFLAILTYVRTKRRDAQ
ncbi:GerAB/ArcD/ProY family transporter [Geobacillus sp. FSL W8-0032]|uniref:Germination protein GerB n=2 Tax=Geobacillus TaxID=129337 RepID=A0A679FN77_9BACL|nr:MULTISPECIES: GerAB/ArcD/ProY family transporter [Geobacillus]KYD23982.1 hypothetical protein B4113_2870 [Geobacillus sp. B4113_201601]MEB3751223.1 Spore germination protein YndE [Geobacillus icigianus]BBW97463.1 germination protein GerB [Geobacillus subterraneus]